MASVTGSGPEELRRLAAKLKEAGPELRRYLARELRDAAKPVVQAVQDAILESPSKHDGTLRREAAKTVSAAVGTAGKQVTLTIVSRGSQMPDGKGNLPAYLNDGTRWRHPVFGDRRNWVLQSSRATGWFDKTINDRAGDLRAAAQAALDDTARELEA